MDYQDKLKNDYEKIIKEYVIDFTKSISITHNQDGTLTSVGQDEERIGVVILKDITPDRIRVSSSNTDLVFSDEVSNHIINVKNWNNSESYRISTLEFDLGLEPIIIRRLGRFSLSDIAEIQDLINKASEICQKKAGCEANIEAKNNDGQTLFHVAAQEGKLRSIRFLIGKIESMNFEDNLYAEPDELVKAVRQRERLKSLINEKDKFDYTPLQYAAKNGKWDIVNLFLDKTAERNSDDVANKDRFSISWTTVHYAVYNGDMNLLNDIFQFLSDKETIINTKDSSDWTPLHYAVYYNALDVVKFLVNKGADINAKDKDGKTPLDLAAQENDTSVAEFLKQTELDKKLLAAVQDADLNGVKDLINQKANINAKDMYGWTPLHFAASRDKLSIVEFLFNNNANIKAKDVYGNTPLHVAAQYSSNLEIVKFLLDKDISGINDITNNGWTPLHVAIQGNKLNTVELLLGRGADIEVRDIYNQTSLDLATRKGYLDIAGILKQVQLDRKWLTIVESGGFNEAKGLIAQGANVDTKDKDGSTLLYSAAEMGDLDRIKFLLDNGANIESKNGEYQATPLHGAITNDRLNAVTLLLDNDADIEATDSSGWTPLHYAASYKLDMVRVLVNRGANINAENNEGKTPLEVADEYGQSEIVNFLVNKKDRHGYTLLHYAAQEGNLDLIKLLIINGANIEARNNEEKTPLEVANESGHFETLRLLINKAIEGNKLDVVTSFLDKTAKARGIDVYDPDSWRHDWKIIHYAVYYGDLNILRDIFRFPSDKVGSINSVSDGWVPLHYAVYYNRKDIISFLVDQGSSIEVQAVYGQRTPLHIAIEEGRSDIFALLISKGAKIDAMDTEKNQTPIQKAREKGRSDMVELLDYVVSNSSTPLHYAAREGKLELATFLLNNGASIDAKDKDGKTPLDIAIDQRHDDIVEYLKKFKEENKKSVQRKRRHHHGNHDHHHSSHEPLAIDLSNQFEIATSSGVRPSSWINVFANIIVDAVKGVSQFISSPFKLAIDVGDSQPSKAVTTQGTDVNGTLLLLDVFIRKITGQKYISTADQPIISLPEAECHASDIINGFEKVLKETAVKSGISVTNLNFDPIKPQSDIVGQLINGKFSEISKTLYSSAKQACPEFKQNKKFLSRLETRIEEFLDKKEKEFSSIGQKRKEAKQIRKRELCSSANFITDNPTTVSLANTSRSESQLPGKTDDKPRTCLNDPTVDNQLQRSL